MNPIAQSASPLRILVVDDEANIRRTLSICLEAEGHFVSAVSCHDGAVAEAGRKVFDLAFVDLRLGTANGLDLIPELLEIAPRLKIVVITAYASIDTAVEAMRRGATDYIAKPFTPAQVKLVTEKIGEVRTLEQRLELLQDDLTSLTPEITFTSSSVAMQRAMELVRQVAPSEAIVLLRGESGTGKSVLARAIHGWSSRAARPIGVVSCPALSPELLESELFGHVKGAFTGAIRDNPGRIGSCEGGTLFLDEIGDLPLSLQPKLLRFTQDSEYERVGDHITRRANVRLLAATNIDLEAAVTDGRFREDLYYRLNVIQLTIPPLRERPDDVETLAIRMLDHFARSNHKVLRGFTAEATQILRAYRWPGNLRELRNVIERAAILANRDWIDPADLPDTLISRPGHPRVGDPVTLAEIEELHIRSVLTASSTLQEAADILGIDQATLWRKRKTYGL